MQKPSLTIGIPALNEAANITYLLESLLSQKQSNFILNGVIVVSDGSSDDTAALARLVIDSRVIVIERRVRKGQAASQDEIIQRTDAGDLLLLLNADVLPDNANFLENFVQPFLDNPKLALASGRGVPLPARSWFEAVVSFGAVFRERMFAGFQGGDNVYNCHGHSRIFAPVLWQSLSFGQVVSEDAYSYFLCKQKNLEFAYVSGAVVNYRSPKTLADHLRQSGRFLRGQKQLEQVFGREVVRDAHALPKRILIRVLLTQLFLHPLLCSAYIFLNIWCRFGARTKNYATLTWETADSSKRLVD